MMEYRTKLVLLGTGNPNADPHRSGPAAAILVDDNAYLIDAGPGVVRRAAMASLKGFKQLEPKRLGRLFLTHLHSDHTVGLPDIIFTPWVMERKEPLKVWGPPGTKEMCRHLMMAYRDDVEIRTKGLEKAGLEGSRVKVSEFHEGVVFRDDRLTVEAFKVKHGAWRHAYGFRFSGPDRTIVISGDCSPTPELAEHYRGADILLHEVYSMRGFQGRSDHWKAYHKSSHTSSLELGELAKEAGPKLLVLYHQLLWGAEPESLVEEIRSKFDGEVVSGNDLDVF
ncbi:MAG: MBL fold metallo-hydrolase [Thermoplasmatota archaeon]